MKSMLQEGATVFKAIKKAWNNCDKPEEFTIKILEFGEKSFFGITKKPAVVSINYNIKKQPKKPEYKFEKKEVSRKEKTIKTRGMIQDFEKNKFKTKQPDTSLPRKKTITYEWTDELIKDVSFWLKEITGIMGIKIDFTCKSEQRILNIFLKESVFKESENEKMFFISLSHLLMQFLRKKYKKKLNNYYLIIHSNILETDGSGKNKAS
ncbi:Jag N-terminal domain-containing protein [Candidatus Dependentiae bacterium]